MSLGRVARPSVLSPVATAPELTTTSRVPLERRAANWLDKDASSATSGAPSRPVTDDEPSLTTSTRSATR